MTISFSRLASISWIIAWLLEQQDISDDSKIQYLERNDQGCNSPSRLHGTSTRIEGAAGLNILNNVRVFLEMKYQKVISSHSELCNIDAKYYINVFYSNLWRPWYFSAQRILIKIILGLFTLSKYFSLNSFPQKSF